MHFKDIQVGMFCNSKKGSGRVTWIDASTRTVYMSDLTDDHQFDVSFDELVEDPQVHNRDDTYY